MPIYEYQCRKCGHRFEKLVKSMSRQEPIACPDCGSKKTEREFSTFAVGAQQSPCGPRADSPCGGCCSAEGGGGCCPME